MSEEYQYPPPKGRRRVRQEWDGQRIKALREFMKMTQQQMADELEVRQQTISEWETGIHRPHRSTQKTLSLVAERVGFVYETASSGEANGNSADGTPSSDQA